MFTFDQMYLYACITTPPVLETTAALTYVLISFD